MRAVSAKEFHDKASQLIRSKEAFIVVRHGKDVLVIYYPMQSSELPQEAE